MERQLYPDTLRAVALGRVVMYHFFGWELLTYFPAMGIMFALGGWFIAISLRGRSEVQVTFQRFARLLPTWWAFSALALGAGFFYAKGAGVPLEPSLSWIFPYEIVTWKLDSPYAKDVAGITWYIATYIWLMMLSPILLQLHKKLSWAVIYLPVIAMPIYTYFIPYQDTLFGETLFNVFAFSGCWLLGFAKADGALDKLPKYLVYLTTAACCGAAIFLTYQEATLSNNPTAISLMSFGGAMLLLSFNPDLSFLPGVIKSWVRAINTRAVTIYLFHIAIVDYSFTIGDYLGAYSLGPNVGQGLCFLLAIGLIYLATKTVGIVETHKWLPVNKPAAQASTIMENGSC